VLFVSVEDWYYRMACDLGSVRSRYLVIEASGHQLRDLKE
jgi:hypothetical protein